MPVFTVAYEEPNGYKYVETSPELKAVCKRASLLQTDHLARLCHDSHRE